MLYCSEIDYEMERKEKLAGRNTRSMSMHVIDDLRDESSDEDDDETIKGSESSNSAHNSASNSAQVCSICYASYGKGKKSHSIRASSTSRSCTCDEFILNYFTYISHFSNLHMLQKFQQ